MTLNGVMAVILRYFSEFGYLPGVLRKSSRSLSHLLMSSCFSGQHVPNPLVLSVCNSDPRALYNNSRECARTHRVKSYCGGLLSATARCLPNINAFVSKRRNCRGRLSGRTARPGYRSSPILRSDRSLPVHGNRRSLASTKEHC